MSEPMFFDLKAASEIAGVSTDLLKAAIHTGTLRARCTSVNEEGKVRGGKYLVTRAALADWFETLVEA
jgi:hypothetical protein